LVFLLLLPIQVEAQVIESIPVKSSNCVHYARLVQKSLPYGLYTLQDKINIIRTQTPDVGSVAITNEGRVGHLSIVIAVHDDYVVIEEENYIPYHRTKRELKTDKVIGYY